MKGGANPSDIRQIAKYFRAGHPAEDIARSMNLSVKCVKSFEPKNVEKNKAEVKKSDDAAAAEHKKKKDLMKKAKAEVAEE